MSFKKRIIIIGASVAGISAAVQLKRSGFEPLVIERSSIGGLVRNANCIENYPGFPDGISGIEFAELLERQARRWNVQILFDNVISADYQNLEFIIKTTAGVFSSEILVVASGTEPLRLPFSIPNKLKSRVFYEIVEIKNQIGKRFIIVGSGDAAFDYALTLSKNNMVTILNRSLETKCLPLLFARCDSIESISYLCGTQVERLIEHDNEIEAGCSSGGKQFTIKADYIIGAIGRKPALDFLSAEIVDSRERLAMEGKLYIIGDASNGKYRQIAISAGDGVKAAMSIASACMTIS